MGALSNVITRIKALITADNKDFKKKMQDTASETEKTSKKVNKSAKGIGTAIKAIMGAAVVGLAVKLTGAMIKVRAEFEKYESMLKVALGSQDAAARSMKQLTEFASKTPFQLNELTDSFVKLVNQGINPTEQQMTNMGDLAAAMGKDFVQLTEAIIDAQTGEFERLKEFGIRATKEGDKVKFTFKGVETQVDFTAKAISNYIFGLGQLQGVSGSMAEVSKTLGGRISNLKDNWTTLMNTMGTQSSGVIMSVVNFMINLANLINENILRMRRFKEEYLDENVRDSLDGMIKGVELWVSENQKAGDNVTEARRKAIDMQLLMEQKYIDDQKRLLNDAIKSGNDKQKEKLEYIIKTQNLAIQALKDHYTEVEKVEAQALLDMNAEQLAAQQQRLKDQKSFFWSWQGLIMDGMGAIQGATLDAFNSQVPAIDAANKGLENYQANLGMLMQAIPLVIPMIRHRLTRQRLIRGPWNQVIKCMMHWKF